MNQNSITGYGVDVAITRADDLDKLMLDYATNFSSPAVLDVGSGSGGQAVRLAKIGAKVTAVDIYNFSNEILSVIASNNLPKKSINFIHANIIDIVTTFPDSNFDFIYLQRMLHYLKYNEAEFLLKKLRPLTKGKLFISVTGINSDISRNYSDKNMPLEARYSCLNEVDAEIFGINEPICLYSESEVKELLTNSGWCIDKIWVSAFGNIKAVCS